MTNLYEKEKHVHSDVAKYLANRTNGMGNSTDRCCFVIQRIKKNLFKDLLEPTDLKSEQLDFKWSGIIYIFFLFSTVHRICFQISATFSSWGN